MSVRSNPRLRAGDPVSDRYRLVRHLASGGMGEVWEAEHRYTGRRVALKTLHHGLLRTDPGSVERFFAEASLQASIRHPGVVDVLDAGQGGDGFAYLVLELLEGHDLESVLRRGRLQPRDLVRVCIQVLDALAACHAQGVLHLDVKPANVFLARSPVRSAEVKLLDFGVARRAWEPGAQAFGTLDFMSPEQAQGHELDHRTDLFAVAAVLYRALTGCTPYRAYDLQELARATRVPTAPLAYVRPDVPEDLAEVVDRGLASIERRWNSALDMAQALAMCDHRGLADLPAAPQVMWDEPSTTAPRPGGDTFLRDSQPTYRIARGARRIGLPPL